MARFASQMKMGFYATPESVVEVIKKHLIFPKNINSEENSKGLFDAPQKNQNVRLRLFDPCCGEGTALSIIARGTNAVTYGNELQNERYAKASECLDHVVRCDALSELQVSSKAFSLLWLNPPYDNYYTGKKLETEFLLKYIRTLAKNGVIVYIIPNATLAQVKEIFINNFKDILILPFGKDEFEAFRQVVVIARKTTPGIMQKDTNRRYWEKVCGKYDYKSIDVTPKTTPDINSEWSNYEVLPSQVPEEKLRFFSIRLDPEEMAKIVKNDPAFEKFAGLVTKHTQNTNIQPLTSLRKGHLAMLLAGGFLNGEIEKNGKRYCIKGNVYTSNRIVDNTIDEKGNQKTTSRTFHDIVINMYDYQKNKFMEVKA